MRSPTVHTARGVLALTGVVAVAVAVDQITKHIAQQRLRGRPFQTVIEGFVELRYSLNQGAFYGLGADLPVAYRALALSLISSLALALGLWMFLRTAPGQRRLRWAIRLLLAGGTGNLIDRIRHGEVIDFIHLHFRDAFHWATFNVADSYLAVGLALLILELLTPPRRAAGNGGQTCTGST